MSVYQNLYDDVVRTARLVTDPPPLDADPTAILCERITLVQKKLRDDLLEKFPGIVKDAAALGKTTADLLAFSGNEKYDDDFSYLFLLKGPRDREQKYDLYQHGFIPLYETLAMDVTPFGMHFTWIPGANQNRVSVHWDS